MAKPAYAAGVLLFSVRNNTVYVLLGKDHYNMYSDFGGKSEMRDRDSIYTATREMYEETCGSLCSMNTISQVINDNTIYVSGSSYTNKSYIMYLVKVLYDNNVCNRFDSIYEYIKPLPHLGRFKEKTGLLWVQLSDVLDNTIPLRNVFKKTVENNRDSILRFASNITSTNTHHRYGRR